MANVMTGVIARAATGEFLLNFNDGGQNMSIVLPYNDNDYKVNCPAGAYTVGQTCTVESVSPTVPTRKKPTAIEWVTAGTGVIGAAAALVGAIKNPSNPATASNGNTNYTPPAEDTSKPNYLLWGGLALLVLAILILVIRSFKNKAA